MKWLVLAMLGGCATDPTYLPSEAHYLYVPPSYASIDDCLAQNVTPDTGVPQRWSCSFTLTLCANGRAAHRQGDTVDDGTYALDGELAHLSLRGERFDFDVATMTRVDDGEQWQLDTEQLYLTQEFDSISCE